MSIAAAQALLDAQLQTVASLPTLQLENTRLNTNYVDSFARSTILPAQSNVLTLGFNAMTEKQGLYQVDLFCSDDIGSQSAFALADLVVAAFPVGLQLTDGTTTVVIRVASVMSAQSIDRYLNVPVQVQWSVYG